MKTYLILTEEGWTVTPNGRRCENKQILGYSWGNTESEAIESFIIHMEDDEFFEIEGWNPDLLEAQEIINNN